MGNYSSIDSNKPKQFGGEFKNSGDLQQTIEKLLKVSATNNNFTENLNFDRNASEFDLNAIVNNNTKQLGGSMLSVTSRRDRYSKIVIPQNNNNSNNKSVENNNNNAKKSVIFSDTSIDSMNQAGGQCNVGTNNLVSDNEFKVLKDVILRNSNKKNMKGGGPGCGCGDNENQISSTSSQPIEYGILAGGNKKKSNKKNLSEDDDDLEDFNIDDDTEEEAEDNDDDDNDSSSSDSDDESNRENGFTYSSLSPSTASSSLSSYSSEHNKKQRRQRYRQNTNENSSSVNSNNETRINAKLLYSSDNNTFYGSENVSDYYKTYKNRSVY